MDFQKILEKQAEQYPHKPAVIFRDSPVTFRQLKELSFKAACSLSGLGITRASKVAIFLPNIPGYIFGYLGVFLLRGICVPLDFMLTEQELINFINHSQAELLIAQEKKNIDFRNIKDGCPFLKTVVFVGENQYTEPSAKDFLSWQELELKASSFPRHEPDEKDTCAIFYTSGSTGHPKGVLLTYGHMDCPIECLEYFLDVSSEDSFLCPGVPFSHLGGLDYMLFMLYFAATLVLMERFHPLEFLKNLEQHKVTIFCIVPSMYVAILSLKEYDNFNLTSLRYAVVFGAPSSAVLLEKFHKVCPNAYLLNGWGMTETAAPNTFLPTGTNTKEIAHTGEFPPGTDTKIVDNEGNTLDAGQEGELWISGKAVMAGYHNEPELTKESLTKDGWLKTGDIVRRDKEGRHYIVGRKKEMIKVGGEIVFCPEVEEVIHRHPKVKEVAVVGVVDKLRGEVPKAFIVVKDGESLNEEEFRFFLRQHLAHFKIPHHFEFRDTLPKNRVGKIDKELLKQVI